MYVCQSAALPGYQWTSTSDVTDALPGWTCEALEKPLPGSSATGWATAWKIARLIEGFPL